MAEAQILVVCSANRCRSPIWRAHGGRQHSSVLSLPGGEDIADPIGRPVSAFEHTRDELNALLVDLAGLPAPDGSEPGEGRPGPIELDPLNWET